MDFKPMVLLLDGSSEHVAWRKADFLNIAFKYDTVVDVTKCLKQVELPHVRTVVWATILKSEVNKGQGISILVARNFDNHCLQ